MKITKVDVMRMEAGMGAVIGCRVYTDAGLYGDGEAALGYGCAAEGAVGQIIECSRLIIGMNPLANEEIWTKLYKKTFWGQNGGPVFFAGVSAIDIALWDIKGKYYKAPIYELLGGKLRDSLRGYASQLQFTWGREKKTKMARLTSPQDLAEQTKIAIADGFDAIKIDYIFDGPDTDLHGAPSVAWLDEIEERIAATRDAAGPKVDIIVENHSHTNALAGVAVGQRAEKYKIFYYEEVCTPEPKLMKYVHDNVNIPIASGERIYTRWQYRPYFEDMSLQIIQPDLGTCGGITEVKKICDMAYTYDVGVQLHTCHTMLSTAAALHVEAAIPNFVIHEDNDHGTMRPVTFDDYVTNYFLPKDGYFPIPEGPGLGTEWNADALRTAKTVTVE